MTSVTFKLHGIKLSRVDSLKASDSSTVSYEGQGIYTPTCS